MSRLERSCLMAVGAIACALVAFAILCLAFLILTGLTAKGREVPHAKYRHDGTMLLPDATATPGALSGLTAAKLCSPTFRTGSVRDVPLSEKRAACAEYGAAACPGPKWELDHLIDIWGGGANALQNIWPQPIEQARRKDVLERRLHKLACDGGITFQEAAHEIATDWYAAYKKYVASVRAR